MTHDSQQRTGSTRASGARDTAALIEQLSTVTAWLSDLTESEFMADSALPGRDVRSACEDIRSLIDQCHDLLETAETSRASGRQLPATTLLQRYWPQMGSAAFDGARSGPEVLAELTAANRRLESVLTAPSVPVAVSTPDGKAKTADLIRVHTVWVVVRADDLSRSLPQREPVPTSRKPLSIACRMLADLLAEQHPGQSIEVRVPPFAAVQCGTGTDGPTHTRGTPPNVVEADPATFVRLATGRLTWSAAVAGGSVSASGQRAELSAVLPILR